MHRIADIRRTNTKYTGADTTSRDEIMFLKSTSELLLSSDTKLFSDIYLQTTFAGFLINDIVDTLVAFLFCLSTTFYSLVDVNIPFDSIVIDTHNGWRTSSSTYNVQISGVYVISYSLAANAKQSPYITLLINGNIKTAIYSSCIAKNGIEIASRTILVSLMVNDNLAINFQHSFGSVYSDIRYQTSIKGFLYKPNKSVPICWYVMLSQKKTDVIMIKLADPVQFDTILINLGSGWIEQTNRFITPSPGVYYIHLTAGICPGKPIKMELLVNGFPFVNVYRQFTSHTGHDVRSRAVLLRLQQNNELRIRMPAGYCMYSNDNGYIGFGGFRLYE